MAAELTTTSAVLLWLGMAADTNGQVARSLLAAEYKIRKVCNDRTSFLEDEYTERFDGLDWDSVVLKHTPVSEAVDPSLAIYTSKTDTVTVDSSSYYIDPETGILRLLADPGLAFFYGWTLSDGGFPDGFRNVAVTYTGGYDANAIPEDLQQIAIEYAAAIYQQRFNDPGMKSENLGRYSYTRADASEADIDKKFRQDLYEAGYARPAV